MQTHCLIRSVPESYSRTSLCIYKENVSWGPKVFTCFTVSASEMQVHQVFSFYIRNLYYKYLNVSTSWKWENKKVHYKSMKTESVHVIMQVCIHVFSWDIIRLRFLKLQQNLKNEEIAVAKRNWIPESNSK